MTLAVELEHANVTAALRAFVQAIRPPPKRNAGEWADQVRVLPPGNAEPGPWRTDRVPYTWPIYQAVQDPRYRQIVIVMGAQMSKTELLLNVIGHRFTDGPFMPALYVGPTEKQVRSMSNDRVRKMIESAPVLAERLARGQDDKVTEKWIGGIRLGFAWAGSPTELSSHPAGLVVVDERDRMSADVGDEGDPVGLAAARLDTFANGKLVICSTPTLDGASPIWRLFLQGTREMWAWPCPTCGDFFVPRLRLFRWPRSTDMGEVREGARVACPHCGVELEESAREGMNAAGRYLPHAVRSDGELEVIDQAEASSSASFWASGLCSPWKRWGELAEGLAKAYQSGEATVLQTVINTGLGEVFKQRGEAPAWSQVLEHQRGIPRGSVPTWAQLVTMGCDVQKDGIYYVIRAWGFNRRSHLVDHGFIFGDTGFDDVWLLWRQTLEQETNGRRLVDVAFIDSGYNPKRDEHKRPDHRVYVWCRRAIGRAFPTKGHDRWDDRPLRSTRLDLDMGGRTIRNGVTLFHINTDHFKTWIHGEIHVPDTAPEDQIEHWTLHADVDDDYCKQIVAEELIVKPSGHRSWVCPRRRANHYLDCEVLATAAALARQVDTLPEHVPAPANEGRAALEPDDDGEAFFAGGDFFERYR